MPNLISHRFNLYKRFELDVWGLVNNNPTFDHPIVNFFQDSYRHSAENARQRFRQFIYSIDVINPDKIYNSNNWNFFSMQLVSLFYSGVNQNNIFIFSSLASSSMGLWVDNFLLMVESRVSTILYSLNWIPNILYINQFLAHYNVQVNNKWVSSSNFVVSPSQVVQIASYSFDWLVSDLNSRIDSNMVYFNFPRYLFVNYKFMFATMYSNPKLSDLSFPILLDIYSLNDLN